MAITELIFPQIKTDPDSLREIEQDWPIISKRYLLLIIGQSCSISLSESGSVLIWGKMSSVMAIVVEEMLFVDTNHRDSG